MQIALNQDEIEAAVEMYLHSQINIAEGQEFSIDFTAGRGPNGLSAAIDIRSAAATTNRTTAPAAKAKPAAVKEPEPEVEAPVNEWPDTTAEEETASTEAEEAADTADESEAEMEAEEKPVRKPGSIFSKAS